MPKYQYIGESHTLIQTAKAVKDKVKVVQGEIVDIEEGIFSDGRLMLAGFQKIVDGVEDIVDGATSIITDLVGGNEEETTEEATTTTTATAEDAGTPTAETIVGAVETTEDTTEETTEEDTTVETTVEDDGKDEVTVTVETTEAPKLDRAKIVAELKELGVEFKEVGTKTVDLAALLEEAKAK